MIDSWTLIFCSFRLETEADFGQADIFVEVWFIPLKYSKHVFTLFFHKSNCYGIQSYIIITIFHYLIPFGTFRNISIQMGKKPDDNENRQSIKKMIHSEMMDRGLVVDKKKKTRSSRDRSRPVSSNFISRVTKLSLSRARSNTWFSADFIYSWSFISIRLNFHIAVILLKCFM